MIALRRVATNGDTTAVLATTNFGDAGVIVIMAVAATADFGDVATNSPQIRDDANNVYQLAYSQINVSETVSGVFLAVAVYICASLGASATPVTFTIPADLQPGDLVTSMVYGMEFEQSFNQYTFDVAAVALNELANFNISAGVVPNGATDLCLCFAIDGSLSNTGDMGFTGGTFNLGEQIATHPGGPTDGASSILAFKEASVSLGTQNLVGSIVVGSANGVNAWILGIRATQAAGSAGKQLTFQISKGPDPKTLPEGRAIATVMIDGSQQTFNNIVTPPGINFPEFSYFPVGVLPLVSEAWTQWWSTEFDLESVGPQGSRMSEVRSVISVSRPCFGVDQAGQRSDIPGAPGYQQPFALAFLTNLTTMQTLVLGAQSLFWHEAFNPASAMTETVIQPMPANQGGMKFRFLVVKEQTPRPDNAGCGKWILNFTNFEVAPMVNFGMTGFGRFD